MPDRVTKKVNLWGKKTKKGGSLEFLDRSKNRYEWDNEEFHEEEEPLPQEELTNPNILAEIPGVDLEADLEGDGCEVVQDEPEPTHAEQADAAAANANLRGHDQADPEITGVQDDVLVDDSDNPHADIKQEGFDNPTEGDTDSVED